MPQALPATHPVQQSYAADLASRQQLAAVSAEALLAAGAVRHLTGPSATFSSSSSSERPAQEASTEEAYHDKAGVKPLQQLQQGARASPRRRLQHLAQQAAGGQQQRMQEMQQQDEAQQQLHHRGQAQPAAADAAAGVRHRVAGRSAGGGVRKYTCGSWQFELDEAQGKQASDCCYHTVYKHPFGCITP